MSVLVTGGAGYIGSHVVRLLTEAGHEVIVLDNLSTGFADSLLYGEQLIVGDLANRELLDSIFRKNRIHAVMHFAASIVAPESVARPIEYYLNNTTNLVNVVAACVRHQVSRIVFSSTAAVYGNPESDVISETAPTSPINPYGTSKLMSEWILRDASRAHDLRYVTLRYFNVAGADPQARMGQRAQATHLIKICCEAALGKRKHVEVFGTDYPTGDGTGVRDYIHVEDLASAHLAALEYLGDQNSSITLNVGYGKGHSVREVIDTVRRVSGSDVRTIDSPRRPGDAAVLVADARRIGSVFQWKPRFASLERIVADAWRWEMTLARGAPSVRAELR